MGSLGAVRRAMRDIEQHGVAVARDRWAYAQGYTLQTRRKFSDDLGGFCAR